MKLRSSKKVRFEDELELEQDTDTDTDTDTDNDTDKEIYSLDADDSLIENNKIWVVGGLIMVLFSINYLYGYTQSVINTTETTIYW
jgi:hypothetical protein